MMLLDEKIQQAFDQTGQVPLELRKQVSARWPNAEDSCYDCGSTISGHHTPLCAFADDETDARDLPAIEGTQWWDKPTA